MVGLNQHIEWYWTFETLKSCSFLEQGVKQAVVLDNLLWWVTLSCHKTNLYGNRCLKNEYTHRSVCFLRLIPWQSANTKLATVDYSMAFMKGLFFSCLVYLCRQIDMFITFRYIDLLQTTRFEPLRNISFNIIVHWHYSRIDFIGKILQITMTNISIRDFFKRNE